MINCFFDHQLESLDTLFVVLAGGQDEMMITCAVTKLSQIPNVMTVARESGKIRLVRGEVRFGFAGLMPQIRAALGYSS